MAFNVNPLFLDEDTAHLNKHEMISAHVCIPALFTGHLHEVKSLQAVPAFLSSMLLCYTNLSTSPCWASS